MHSPKHFRENSKSRAEEKRESPQLVKSGITGVGEAQAGERYAAKRTGARYQALKDVPMASHDELARRKERRRPYRSLDQKSRR